MKQYKFSIPILEVLVLVSFEKDPNKGRQAIEKFIGSESDMDIAPDSAVAFVVSSAHRIGVWFGNKPERHIIVHECLHILQDAYDFPKASVGDEKELDAHFLEYIAKRVFECYDKHQKSIYK